MLNLLRQSTAISVKAGPMLDNYDASPETALIPAVYLSKNGGALTPSDATATHDALGYYSVSLDADDTDTCGRMRMVLSASGALSCWEDYMVVPQDVYDALIGEELIDGKVNATYTVTLGGVGVQGALVEVFTDSARTNRETFGFTNEVGQKTFRLLPGTYYMRTTKAPWTFPDDVEIVP